MAAPLEELRARVFLRSALPLVKVVLALERGRLPASLHFARPNPNIPFERLRLVVQREVTDWPAAHPRRDRRAARLQVGPPPAQGWGRPS